MCTRCDDDADAVADVVADADGDAAGAPAPPVPTAPALSRVVTVARTGSTNEDLRRALSGEDGLLDPDSARDWPHLSALRALSQTAGRGRAGRRWTTPEHGALTVSVVLRPLVPARSLGWLPLLAGLAVRDALDGLLGDARPAGAVVPGERRWTAWTKWPNDVVLLPPGGAGERVEGWGAARKAAGVLTEVLLPAGGMPSGAAGAAVPTSREGAAAVVVGIGVNVARPEAGPAVPWAMSLEEADCPAGADEVLRAVAAALRRHVEQWEARGGDPDAGDGALGRRLRQSCLTLGQRVRVETPRPGDGAGEDGDEDGQGVLRGVALDLRPGLVLRTDEGVERVLLAGDVLHVRQADGGRWAHRV